MDGQKTSLFVVGKEGQHCIIALPFTQAHAGSWSQFEVEAVSGHIESVRMTRVAKTAAYGFRRQPPRAWGQEYEVFAPGLGFSQGALALYKITPHIFANVESTLYFAFGSGAVSTPFGGTGGFSGRSPIPLSFGGGYMFTEQTAFRLNLQLTSITRSPGVGMTLSAVQFF